MGSVSRCSTLCGRQVMSLVGLDLAIGVNIISIKDPKQAHRCINVGKTCVYDVQGRVALPARNSACMVAPAQICMNRKCDVSPFTI